MRGNPDIPNELYYLDNSFQVQSLRKYQFKEILSSHNVSYPASITRSGLLELFEKHIVPQREEILKEYKLKELKEKEELSKETLGRGHRTIVKPLKFEEELVPQPIKRRQRKSANDKVESTQPVDTFKKDKDGFAIPSTPPKKFNNIPAFTAEDSFGEEGEEEIKYSNRLNSTAKVQPKQNIIEGVKSTKSKQQTKKPKNSVPKFDPEDSFVSSSDDDEVNTQQELTQKSIQKENNRAFKQEPFSFEVEEPEVKEIEQKEAKYEKGLKEEEDLSYEADSDTSDDEAEVEEKSGKNESAPIHKEQLAPLEVFTSPDYPTSQIGLWKNKFVASVYLSLLVYLFIGLTMLSLYLSKDWIFSKMY